jgi:hypothetical protein
MIPKFMETARLWFASGSRDAKPAPGATKPQTSAAAYKGQQAPDDAAGPPRTRVRDRAGAVGHPTHLLSGGRTSAARAADRSAVDVCVAHVSGSARPLSAENIEKTAGEAGVATSVAKEAGVDLPMAITGSLPADASLEALLLAAGVTNRPELARHRILQLIAAKVAQLDITPTAARADPVAPVGRCATERRRGHLARARRCPVPVQRRSCRQAAARPAGA